MKSMKVNVILTEQYRLIMHGDCGLYYLYYFLNAIVDKRDLLRVRLLIFYLPSDSERNRMAASLCNYC